MSAATVKAFATSSGRDYSDRRPRTMSSTYDDAMVIYYTPTFVPGRREVTPFYDASVSTANSLDWNPMVLVKRHLCAVEMHKAGVTAARCKLVCMLILKFMFYKLYRGRRDLQFLASCTMADTLSLLLASHLRLIASRHYLIYLVLSVGQRPL